MVSSVFPSSGDSVALVVALSVPAPCGASLDSRVLDDGYADFGEISLGFLRDGGSEDG